MDYPILVGPSRKSFLAQPSESDTLFATAAAVAAAVLNGAHIVRVHDVGAMHVVVQVAEEIARAAVPKAAPGIEEADRRATRPRTQATPNIEAERPRPPRPPVSRPVVAQPAPEPQAFRPAEERKPAEERRPAEERPAAPPPRREFRPAADRFKPAAGKRTFERKPFERKPFEKKPFERKDDRRADRPADRGPSRPRFAKDGPPKREFRTGPPRSGPPRSGPGDDRFKPARPPRSFDRGPDRSRPPRTGAPPKPGGRPGGDRPPKRPFRKRP